MDEKSSMMAYSDVVVTVYSTMLVETAVHDTPMIAATIDVPGGGTSLRNIPYRSRKLATGQRTNVSAKRKQDAWRPMGMSCAMR